MLKMIASISCAFSGLCFAILALDLKNVVLPYQYLRTFLWFSIVVFASSGLRAADRLLDILSTQKKIWPSKNIPIVGLDNRVLGSGCSTMLFFIAWLLFTGAIGFLGHAINLSLWQIIIGVGIMIVADILFITWKLFWIE